MAQSFFLIFMLMRNLLPPLSVFQYVAAFSDRLNALRFVLSMRIDGHNSHMTIQLHSMFTAAGAWLQRWIHFGGRRANWLQRTGPETDMLYVCMVDEENYKRRFYRRPHRLCRQIDERELSQPTILPSVDLVCFDCPFPDNWFENRTEHFLLLLDFAFCARECHDTSRVLAGWYYGDRFANLPLRRAAFWVTSSCSEWEWLDTHRSLLVSTPPLFSYYSRWIKRGLRRLILSVAQS